MKSKDWNDWSSDELVVEFTKACLDEFQAELEGDIRKPGMPACAFGTSTREFSSRHNPCQARPHTPAASTIAALTGRS